MLVTCQQRHVGFELLFFFLETAEQVRFQDEDDRDHACA